jgi:hypothetical protein
VHQIKEMLPFVQVTDTKTGAVLAVIDMMAFAVVRRASRLPTLSVAATTKAYEWLAAPEKWRKCSL